jgi:predicted PurR-regulated permease PerM
MVPVFLFYFLLESASIAKNWHTVLPIRRSAFREEVVGTLQEINNYIISFVRGQMLVSVIDGIILAIALKIMGLPYAVTIAAAAALLGVIPYLGMIGTWIPAVLIAWFTWHDVSHVVIVSVIFACVSQFDGWVLQPRILGSRVKMHDLTIMFSVLFWSFVIGGVVGALLAVPLTASLKVLFTRYIWSSYRNR